MDLSLRTRTFTHRFSQTRSHSFRLRDCLRTCNRNSRTTTGRNSGSRRRNSRTRVLNQDANLHFESFPPVAHPLSGKSPTQRHGRKIGRVPEVMSGLSPAVASIARLKRIRSVSGAPSPCTRRNGLQIEGPLPDVLCFFALSLLSVYETTCYSISIYLSVLTV